MGQNLCIGAAEESSGRPLRLIPADEAEYHSWREFGANVGSIIDVTGTTSQQVEAPHFEDFLVRSWTRTGRRKAHLSAWIRRNCTVWTGPRSALFGGRLRFVASGKGVVNRSDQLPLASVGFWSLPGILRKVVVNEKVRFQMSGRLPVDMPYVGVDAATAPAQLRTGTLVRVSLSRWLAPRDVAFEEACWLQLSGYYKD